VKRRLASEFVATAFLVAVVVGSGIAGDRLSDSTGLALLINAFATGAGLVALILAFGPASGAHMNPVVSMVDAWFKGMSWNECAGYVAAQVGGGMLGAVAANLMYGEPAVSLSRNARGGGLWLAEAIATLGLIAVILGCARSRRPATAVAFAVGAYIASAYFFTASTSFANPAVTVARMFSDTFTGIEPTSALAFVPAQVVGGLVGAALLRYLYPGVTEATDRVVIPHPRSQEGPQP
jgi:arsenate reductase